VTFAPLPLRSLFRRELGGGERDCLRQLLCPAPHAQAKRDLNERLGFRLIAVRLEDGDGTLPLEKRAKGPVLDKGGPVVRGLGAGSVSYGGNTVVVPQAPWHYLNASFPKWQGLPLNLGGPRCVALPTPQLNLRSFSAKISVFGLVHRREWLEHHLVFENKKIFFAKAIRSAPFVARRRSASGSSFRS